jgi:hypothetical protein
MEDLIKAFMAATPQNSGYGDGYGSGDGYGDGDGSGSGSGDGSGYGDGSGSGDGSGYGDGDGSGYGYGDGSGYGYGYGYGDGYGDGDVKTINHSEYKKGFLDKQIHSLKSFNGDPVYYIDNIPCTFLSIVNNVAKVAVIKDDFSIKKMYIAKSGNLFAHGDTKEQALRAVNEKFYASMSFEERKAEFISKFKNDAVYPNRHFFEWHHLLTGSCESGRMMFVESHGIDLDAGMNTITFLNLTKNEYNGEIIKDILSQISY